ncbi:DUF465 domain-containing protein [Siculibacillus lacustris]|uniref:DUF465 domain-containing protein n=2 Tax=Siculibacillus lacustris TaxID=1549641 RepID=A0A4Q9VXE0_9HYPH|nr:DUF465 domain-containing protein [Siculibacillus lacustris]
MSLSSHDLVEEFPGQAEQIRDLAAADLHFSNAVAAYTEVNREVLRIESEMEPASDEYLETLKKKRLRHLDEIHEKLLRQRHTGT